jgi:AP-1-like factor
MESYPGVTPLWDLSQASSFSQLPDDDFLALLQKQFPNSNDGFMPGGFDGGINPQSIQPFALPGLSPPSDDSSPSPPGMNDTDSRGPSMRPRADTDGEDAMLKRKASDDSMDDEGPSQKNQHTAGPDRRSSTSTKRKSTGGNPDESRLMKRKEQNRAAQRAFRERKEKHVKDLEDKVAALEAKNEQATSENVNLRDLLTRLQDENVSLKQAAFTFSVPKTTGNNQSVASGSGQSSMNLFNTPALNPISPFSPSSTVSSIKAPVFPDNMDWTSLTTFDPAVLSLLDDSPPQTTATDSAMNMDFGFGSNGQPQQSQFTTIAANPMFMSFADFDSSDSSDTNSAGSFNFDAWTNSPRPDAAATKDPGLDELFGGSYLGNQGPVDFNVLMMGSPPTTLSPVVHHRSPGTATSGSSSSSNSTSIPSEGQSPISSVGTSPAADDKEHNPDTCPRTKAEAAERVKALGVSPFVTEQTNTQRAGDELVGKMVSCASGSSSLPSTEPKDDDLEVLAAWQGVIKDPNFKVTCLQSIHEFDHH